MGSNTDGSGNKGFCVIMAGGRGTRFWPLSRTERPKQLLALSSEQSLLRETYQRVLPLVGPERVLIVVSGNLAAAVRKDLPELPPENVITEPVGRNTAPCAALGIGLAAKLGGAGPVALLPADHFIPDPVLFREQLSLAFDHAESTRQVVTFGIPPTSPATGYGYIEVAEPGVESIMSGLGFVEKPDLPTARGYVEGNRHFWNSGIFVWDSRHFATALAEHLPDIATLVEPAVVAYGTDGFPAALAAAYTNCPSLSIDVGIMERMSAFSVLRASFRWSDLGSWDAWGELTKDLGDSNSGSTDLLALDSQGSVIYAPEKLVALINVKDLIIVDTDDALLVCPKQDSQRIREVIAQLEQDKRKDLL